jgi:hypothetical protein
MNATRVSIPVGRRPGMTLTIALLLLAALRPAKGAEIVITLTGVIAGGYDQFPLFGVGTKLRGNAGWDLKGQPFTLVYTFDDTKGKPTPPENCAGAASGIKGDFDSSPGVVTLTIGEKSVTVGTRKDSHSGIWREINSSCSQSMMGLEVMEGGGWSNGNNIFNIRVMPVQGGRSLTQNPDWKAPLTVTNPDNSGVFVISRRGDFGHEVKGSLDIKKMVISRK